MILHQPRQKPQSWSVVAKSLRRRWTLPFVAFEWTWEWAAYLLSHWSLLEVLEYLGSFSVLVAVILYFSESGDRTKQKHYQAWQVINTAQGKGGSGGRIEALQELNADAVALTGVDLSGAFLQGVRLERAALMRADMNACDLRDSDLAGADLSYADLHSANLRGSALERVKLANANLSGADLNGANLSGAELAGAALDEADLTDANLSNIDWHAIKSARKANLADVRNAPAGFTAWALAHGAVQYGADK